MAVQLNHLTQEIEKLKSQAGNEKGERDSLEHENNTLKTENGKLEHELKETNETINSLKQRLDLMTQNYENEMKQLEILRNEENENKQTIERYNGTLSLHRPDLCILLYAFYQAWFISF